jgi:hypothetical protein
MNAFPHFINTPFREILLSGILFTTLRKLKFNKNNFWEIKKEDINLIYDSLNSIQKGDKIIMYKESPFVFVNKNGVSNTLFRPILSKIFYGYSHHDFIDFLIELTLFHRICYPIFSGNFKVTLRRISEFYPDEKNIFDELLRY